MVIVPDSSAWIDYLRATGSPWDVAITTLLQANARVVVTEVVAAEVLAGARSSENLEALRRQLFAFPVLRLEGLAGFEAAAAISRACRAGGETVRSLLDCLIAVPVIRIGGSILHKDRDFEVIARYTPLRVYPVIP